jgi:hypothetical protein
MRAHAGRGASGSAIDNLLPSLWSGSDYHTELEGANHEAFYRCYSRWADDRRIALNVGIGLSVFGPQLQRSEHLGLWHLL